MKSDFLSRPHRQRVLPLAIVAAVIAGCLLVARDGPQSADSYIRRIELTDAQMDSKDQAILLNNTPLAIPSADAVALNAARPPDRYRLERASPFFMPMAGPGPAGAASTALDCLTQVVYYEAANESDQGQRAVAQVVLNRVRHPAFPHSVCGVVYQGSTLRTGCQFSFTCDGSLSRRPMLASWMRSRRSALAALSGRIEPSVGLATHYHASYVVPYWASSLDKLVTIGAHIFYAIRGRSGSPGAFKARYDAAAELIPFNADEAAAILDPLAIPPGDSAGGVAPVQPPRNRTTVVEDALRPLSSLDQTLAAPAGTLRADEASGQLVLDKNTGVLDKAH